jgi:monoamine oxidase
VSSPAAEPGDEEAICRNELPLAFCGEHTARGDGGLMEGALRSGLRAAEVVGSLA